MEVGKDGEKDGKSLYKLMKNAVYGKKVENLRNKIHVKPVSNKKDYLKYASKPNYMSDKIFDKDLLAIHRNKVTLQDFFVCFVVKKYTQNNGCDGLALSY